MPILVLTYVYCDGPTGNDDCPDPDRLPFNDRASEGRAESIKRALRGGAHRQMINGRRCFLCGECNEARTSSLERVS